MKLVLVVDDDPATRDALGLVLALEGFAVEAAASAAEAIACAAQLRPAAIVCDLALGPGGDGLAVARAVRGVGALAATRLVALSGADTAVARASAHEAGFDAFLLKPVTAAVLLEHLPDVTEA